MTGTKSSQGGLVQFRECACGLEETPHGYLYKGNGRMPVTVASVQSGGYLLKEIEELEPITASDVDRLEGEMREAGLPESLGEELESQSRSMIDGQLFRFVLSGLLG